MAREVITIHVGELGIQIAPNFWKYLCDEHNIDYKGQEKGKIRGVIDNFFEKASIGKWIPRTILVDLGPNAIRKVTKKDMKDFFDPKRCVMGLAGDANLFAKGYYSYGTRFMEEIMDKIQKEVDQTEHLQGFIVVHSIGDGTGAGLAPLIMEAIKKKHPKPVMMSYSIVPSQNMDCSTILPYNAILSLDKLTSCADISMIIDNDSIYRIVATQGKENELSESIFDQVLAKALVEITATLRFNSPLNRSMMEMSTNLVPFPRNHFLITSMSPLETSLTSAHQKIETEELMRDLIDQDHILAPITVEKGVFTAFVIALRGENPHSILQNSIKAFGDRVKFSEIFPTAIKADSTTLTDEKLARSGVTLMNHSGVANLFQFLLTQFELMYDHDAFTTWYYQEGMQPSEFEAAKNNIQKLITEYKQDEY
ncbi:hypothetical protein [Candidatus Lokiarchaeum ossiferum]|uniref:hypothetical protein n=1 Tax=Candidatus Lokiarchaeum ossiferum TaxID=2951803 RepID=UPI00352F7BD6